MVEEFYSELLEAVKSSPDKYLNTFQKFLTTDSPTLRKFISYPNEEFNYTINRFCYILINQSTIQRVSKIYVVKLIEFLEDTRFPKPVAMKLQQFFNTLHYDLIRQLGDSINDKTTARLNKGKVVKQLIDRYPFLYENYLVPEKGKHHLKDMMTKKRKEKFQKFTTNLSSYLIQRSMTGVNYMSDSVTKAQNPTLLSTEQLDNTIEHFTEKVENNQSYREVSRSFLIQTSQVENYQDFKKNLYGYVVNSLDKKDPDSPFQRRLIDKLNHSFPQYDRQKPDEILTKRTATNLLDFLVVEGSHELDHYVFVDMVTNLGTNRTLGLLLKIMLAYPETRGELERRLAILFKHYEAFSPEGINWLVSILENLNIALSIHFEGLDISGLKLIKGRKTDLT